MTPNKLFVFGCSYATGEELLLGDLMPIDSSDPHKFFDKIKKLNLELKYQNIRLLQKNLAWPQLLANRLGRTCINKAESGNSLDKMLYQFLTCTEITESDIVIISLTKPTRNAKFNGSVESFQLPSLYYGVDSLIGVDQLGGNRFVFDKNTDKALVNWFSDDRILWDFIKNIEVFRSRNVYIVPAMSFDINASQELKDMYNNLTESYVTHKSLDDFTDHYMPWGHPNGQAHTDYADHLYEIFRKL